jgi:two-component system chemotaxis sensor kinase CheA
MGEMDEVVAEFLAESREGLDSLDRDFVTLEANPNDAQTLARIFRCAHTIKGTAGFLGFSRLESVTHAGESLLSRLRDGELKLSPEMTNSLLSMVDAVRTMLAAVETTGADGNEDHAALVAQLHKLLSGEHTTEAAGDDAHADAEAEAEAAAQAEAEAEAAEAAAAEAFEAPPPPPAKPAPAAPKPAAAKPAPAPAKPAVAAKPAAPAPVAAHAPEAPHTAAPEAAPPEGQAAPAEAAHGVAQAAETIRVDVDVIDRLMDLAGELVLTRNQILQINTRSEDSAFSAASQRLNVITAELQDGIMKMRMMPIDNVFSKFPRIVRELSRACNKQVRVEIDGKNTELDKTLIEAIKDPLTHLLRNAVDHGIEMPADRIKKGKNPEGVLTIRAFHESGQVHIQIEDDGGGIPLDKVRAKALSRNLVPADQLAKMSDEELCSLIFLPGFSTAAAVTNVSGRGVGMDVVKTNVEKIGGTVTVDTRLNRGTTFGIKIPLTLAIVPALIVAAGRSRFAIPQVSLLELVGFDPTRDLQKIENFHGAPVFRLRGQLLPLVFLDKEIGQDGGDLREGSVRIVVLQVADRRFGLVVDRIIDQQEIVVKPLARQVKGIPIFAGATILGDGRVALILDVMGLAQQSGIVSDMRSSGGPPAASIQRKDDGDLITMLLLKSPDDGRMAIPLDRVSRLETVSSNLVETVGDQMVLRHGNDIMPLVSVNAVIPERRTVFRSDEGAKPADLPLNVVVMQRHGVPVGLIVDDILDVVDISLKSRRVGSRPGVTGCVVIHDRVTELLDLDWVLSNVNVSDDLNQASA